MCSPIWFAVFAGQEALRAADAEKRFQEHLSSVPHEQRQAILAAHEKVRLETIEERRHQEILSAIRQSTSRQETATIIQRHQDMSQASSFPFGLALGLIIGETMQ